MSNPYSSLRKNTALEDQYTAAAAFNPQPIKDGERLDTDNFDNSSRPQIMRRQASD